MFVMITFSCIVGAAYHVKCGLAEYVFLQLGRDRTAKDMILDLSSLKNFRMIAKDFLRISDILI